MPKTIPTADFVNKISPFFYPVNKILAVVKTAGNTNKNQLQRRKNPLSIIFFPLPSKVFLLLLF
jgi:hypothetical protein